MPTIETSAFAARQPYRIALIGEKSSLAQVLQPVARRVGAELLLPNGETTSTMIAEMAARADEDGRPLVVLYFSDFDPAGWQMPERMAKARQEPEPDWRERKAPVRPADMPASPLPEQERAPPEPPRPPLPVRTPEEQLAALGFTPESAAAALKATNERRGVK